MASIVAEAVADGMRQDGVTSIGWGDGPLLDYAGHLVRPKVPHPLNRMRAIFAHLERSPSLFEKSYRRSMNARGADVVVRVFILKEDHTNG
ncbi:MAG: hypothetical protein VX529_08180 [Pseudomonadota bacterium]|nr:hypothetical protein [Pseudomonadota bacterium]